MPGQVLNIETKTNSFNEHCFQYKIWLKWNIKHWGLMIWLKVHKLLCLLKFGTVQSSVVSLFFWNFFLQYINRHSFGPFQSRTFRYLSLLFWTQSLTYIIYNSEATFRLKQLSYKNISWLTFLYFSLDIFLQTLFGWKVWFLKREF